MNHWTFTNYCKSKLKVPEDVVSKAKVIKGMNIIVDYHSFKKNFFNLLIKKLISQYENKYLIYFLSEYEIIEKAFYDLQLRFAAANINLIWIIGFDNTYEYIVEQDPNDWVYYTSIVYENKNNLYSNLEKKNENITYFSICRSENLQCVIKGLRKANAEVIQIMEDKFPMFILQESQRREIYAVWCNRLDICFMSDLRWLRFEQYSFQGIDNVEGNYIFDDLEIFNCEIITRQNIIDHFEFQNVDQVLILGIMSGTIEKYFSLTNELLIYLRLDGSRMKHRFEILLKISNFIKNNYRDFNEFENNDCIKKFLKDNPHFQNVISHFKEYKSCSEKPIKSTKHPPKDDSSLKAFIEKKFCNLEVDRSLLTLYNGLYFDPRIQRDEFGDPTLEELSYEIISQIYPYVLNEDLSEVNMWSDSKNYIKVPVTHNTLKIQHIIPLPSINFSSLQRSNCGIVIFEKIWSHLENPDYLPLFETFDIETGFICYILRYLYRKYKSSNQSIDKNHFKNLFCTIFFQFSHSRKEFFQNHLDQEFFLRLKICPNAICVNILKRFMHLYVVAKRDVGDALNITVLFPEPCQIMSSTVLYAFFEIPGSTDLENHIIEKMEKVKDEIMNRYQLHYSTIIKDL